MLYFGDTGRFPYGPKPHDEVLEYALEIADVLVYLVRLATVLGVDLDEAVRSKLAANEIKYPVALARGHARKYSQL